MNVGKRILMFLHWLLSLLICAAFTIYILWPDFLNGVYNGLFSGRAYVSAIIGAAFLAIYLILCIIQVALIFRRSEKRFERGMIVVDSSETGRVRIAVGAIEQMVRQSVCNIDGIADMKIAIENSDDAIEIGVTASIYNGCHVPTITMSMQQAIRKFVEMNCGVAVRAISININAVVAPGENGRRKRGGGAAIHRESPVQAPPAGEADSFNAAPPAEESGQSPQTAGTEASISEPREEPAIEAPAIEPPKTESTEAGEVENAPAEEEAEFSGAER